MKKYNILIALTLFSWNCFGITLNEEKLNRFAVEVFPRVNRREQVSGIELRILYYLRLFSNITKKDEFLKEEFRREFMSTKMSVTTKYFYVSESCAPMDMGFFEVEITIPVGQFKIILSLFAREIMELEAARLLIEELKKFYKKDLRLRIIFDRNFRFVRLFDDFDESETLKELAALMLIKSPIIRALLNSQRTTTPAL